MIEIVLGFVVGAFLGFIFGIKLGMEWGGSPLRKKEKEAE